MATESVVDDVVNTPGSLDAPGEAAIIDPSSMTGDIEVIKEVIGENEEVLGYYGRFKSFVLTKRKELKPWGQFANIARMKKPANMSETMKRVSHNVETFQANYIFVMLILALYCIITSPFLLVALAFLGISSHLIMNERKDRVILGQVISKEKQLQLAVGITIPLLWVSAAGGTVFWIVGMSLFTVVGHAAIMPIPGSENPMHDII
eukprot:m.46564 g.46564  ORF g.46564 m.46564 type:complete len:206 (-) comp10386_c0_seq2:2377-2994(-)